MFGASAALLSEPHSSAKEAMDDLLGTTSGDVEEDSYTMIASETSNRTGGEEEVPMSNKSEKIHYETHEQFNAPEAVMIDPALESSSPDVFDGDVEDNDDGVDDARTAIREMRSRYAVQASANDKRKRTRQATITEGPVRSSARLFKGIAASTKGTKRGGSRLIGAMSNNTTRRTTGSQPKMKGVTTREGRVTKRLVRGTKSGLRLRNWQGELIGDGEAIVVVYADEVEDVDEFVVPLE